MSEAMEIYGHRPMVVAQVTQAEIEVAKNTIAKDATDAEFRLFLHDCQRQGVHPLDRQLHFTKRGGKYVPISSIDLLRSRAEGTGEYVGNGDPEFVEADGQPTKATVTVRRVVNGVEREFTASARWSEFYPGEKDGFKWRQMPFHMLGKCAEALALRKAFPRQLSGIYVKEEMDRDREASNPAPEIKRPQRKSEVKEAKGALESINKKTHKGVEWVIFEIHGDQYKSSEPEVVKVVDIAFESGMPVQVEYSVIGQNRVVSSAFMIQEDE